MKGIYLGLFTGYDYLSVYEIDGKHYLGGGTTGETDYKEISQEFFKAVIKEFGEPTDLTEEWPIDPVDGIGYKPHEYYDEMRKEAIRIREQVKKRAIE